MVQRVEAWGNVLEFPDGMSDDDMASAIRKNESSLNPDYKPKDIGFLGTLKEGAKGTLRNLGATVDTIQGDGGEVVSASRAAAEAPKDPALSALLSDIEQRKKALGDDPSWLDAVKTVGGAALSNPKGAGLLLAEQLPNSGAALAAGGAGALAGSAFGPVGTIAGGLAGLFGANTALETGGKAIEAAADGKFTPEEQSRVLKEGAIKGGVITGVDAATLGLTNFITGTTRRAVERATAKTLADHGVDVTSKAAVEAAAKNPAIAESVKTAQELAAKATTTLGQRVARTSGAAGPETFGEGTGEYLGEMAATGKADKVDAAVEALAGTGMSAGEIAFTAARNKAKLETILGKPVTEVSDKVLNYTAARGGERAKAAARAELNRRAAEGVDPEIANAPESTSEAVERIVATGREKADEIRSTRADAIQDSIFDEETENTAENAPVAQSQPVPDEPTPESIQTLNAQINALSEGRKPGVLLTPGEPMPDALPEGVQAAEIPGRGILLYRDEAALRDALEGRMGEALGYGIDEKPTVTFKTAKGSTYKVVGNTTIRDKAARPGHPGEVGIQPKSDVTIYVTPEQLGNLDIVQTKGGDSTEIAALGDGRFGARYRSGKDKGKFIRGTVITPQMEPAVGLHPVEIIAGKTEHFGNLITEVNQPEQVVTARDENGTVIQDVATDGRTEVERAAAAVAGPNGTVETRPVQEAMTERGANSPEFEGIKAKTGPTPKTNVGAALSEKKTGLGPTTGPARETRSAPSATSNEGVSQTSETFGAQSPAGNESVSGQAPAVQPVKKAPKPNKRDLRAELEEYFRPGNIVKSSYWKTNDRVLSFDWNNGLWSVTVEQVEKGNDGQWKAVGRQRTHSTEPEKKNQVIVERAPQAVPKSESIPESSETQSAETHPLRPLVESLIKRRAAAKQSGKERSINNAIARAKEVLDGKRTDPALESKWFRVQAAGMKNADAETATILREVSETIKQKKEVAHEQAQGETEASSTEGSAAGFKSADELRNRAAKAEIERRRRRLSKNVRTPQSGNEVLKDDGPKFSRAPNKEDIAFAHDFLVELSDVDELFRHKVSHKTSLKGVFEDVHPKAKYLGEDTREDERQESGADHRYVFRSPFGRLFYVFERDNGEVFINVAEYRRGESGMDVYAAVANYAYNTNKRFIGDPAGLTTDSTIRRTSNMLSSAIRYGTTKHFEAAPEQIKGDPKNGIEPLDWGGDDVAKIRSLIHTFTGTLHNQFPALKGYKYDFATKQFTDRRGRPVGPDRFADAARLGVAQASRAGEATMRRGILIQSLVSSSSGERPGLLEQVLRGSRAFVLRGKLEGIFSRKKESDRIASVRKRLKTASEKKKQATPRGGLSVSEIEKILEPFTKQGLKVFVVETEKDLPESLRKHMKSQTATGIRGVYIPQTDEIWLVASRLKDAEELAHVFLHEARHRGLRKLYGKGLDPILRQIYVTNARIRRMADVLSKALDISKEDAVDEVLADLPIDEARALNGWKKLVRFIKQWIAEKFDLTFTDEMVEQLVLGAQIAGAKAGEVSFDEDTGVRFSRVGNNASWDAPEPSKLDDLIYSLQNKHIDLKRVTEAVRESGKQLAEKFNTYLQEELFHGRTAKRIKDFVNEELKPLIGGLRLRGLSIDELDKYLHARHAKEANALIAQRDPNMPDGGSGMTLQEARDYFKGLDPEKRRKLEQVAKKVDDIILGTRDLYLSYGLIDQATYDSWGSMFKHYVPLMREDKDGGMGIGQGFSIKGKEAKHRTGSKRAVVDILANIALQREKAIVRGEKNRVAVSLAGLAKLNPNPDFWTFDKVPTERVMNEATGLVEERPVPGFKDRDNVVVAKIRDSKGKVIERAVVFNENDPRAMRMAAALKNLDVDQLSGLMGVSAKITRYFASINTQYNPVFGVVNLVRDLQGSLLNLSSTPIAGQRMKVLAQVIPAIQAIYASSRGERKGKQANSPMAALWDEMQREGGMTGYRDLFKTSEDRAKAIQRELYPTAWMNSGLGKVFTAGGMLKVPLAVAQKKAGWLFDWLSDYNQTLEGAMRLSAYKVAVDQGLSKQEAASIAKNSTVNFNRKGQSGQQAGALYAFFNAAMQGTARIGETMFDMDKGDIKTLRLNRTGKNIITGGITLGAMQALALAAAGFDDDDPPEFVRERSLIIPIGDKKYITIPMPLGFHVIPNIGRISTEFAMGGFKNKAERTVQLFSLFAEAFNPIGSSSTLTQTLSFTATDPLVALAENKDWTGKPIAKEDFNKLSPTPGFSRNKDTASDPAKWIAEAINTISGGNKYVPGMFSPTADQIDYLFGQATGGVGREASKLNQTVAATFSGEDLPPHKIPLVGRFFGDSSSSSSQGNKFYNNLKRINEVEAELKGRTKDRLPVDEFKAENPEYKLIEGANYTQRAVSNLRRRKSELIEKDAPREQVKAVEGRITQLMKRLNDRVKEVRTAP